MLKETIQRLKRVIRDPHCRRMNKSTVVGFLGEVVVREKLLSEGLLVEHKGNQSGHDLEVKNGPKIDVKACTPRKDPGPRWGWALFSKTKKRPLTISHFICVAFTESLDVDRFYVIKVESLSHFPPSSSRWPGVLHSYNIFDELEVLKDGSPWLTVKSGCEKAKAEGHIIDLAPGDRISDALKK